MSSDQLPERPLGRVAILGLGMMGGSLARAISELQLADRLTGWSPQATEREAALTAGALTFAATDWRRAVLDADLVVIATPLRAASSLLPQVGDAARYATVTDVASLKAPMAAAAERGGLADRFVGSHPMTGGEESGFWASRHDLFEGTRVWTVGGDADPARVAVVDRLWTSLGAGPREIEAGEHDRLMGLVSHLPQIVATAIADVLADGGITPAQLGPGGRDMTRLAGSDPRMWRDLLDHASPDLVEALRGVSARLADLADHIETGEGDGLDVMMRRTRFWRRDP